MQNFMYNNYMNYSDLHESILKNTIFTFAKSGGSVG